MKKIAVLLLNLGGPLTQADVKPFLYNLFSDKYIIGLPFGLRHLVARLISSRREKPAQANYQFMGGGSPILSQTKSQAEALEAYANKTISGAQVKTFIGMRHWHPRVKDILSDIEAFAPDEIILLPLYPQFSKTTTQSSIEEFRSLYNGKARVKSICCYPQSDFFIKAHQDLIRQTLGSINTLSDYRLLFSAHGLPESVIKSGDPYQNQIEASVSAIMAGLDLKIDHTICYQSRVGPLKWIGPSTEETIAETATMGKNIVLVPIAFVSEHIETLVELDIEYADLAAQKGVSDYRRVPALGSNKDYVRALCDEVIKSLSEDTSCQSDFICPKSSTQCPRKRA